MVESGLSQVSADDGATRRRVGPLGRLMLSVLAIALASGFALLGRWQWDRAEMKDALLERQRAVLERRTPLDPVRIDASVRQGIDWLALEGEFADLPPLLLDNQLRDGRVGVRIYRVFLPHRGPVLLAEMGWTPMSADRSLPDVPRPEGTMRIEGLLLPPPAAGLATGPLAQHTASGWLLTRLDPPALQATLGLDHPPAARVFRPDPEWPSGYQRDFDLLPNTLPPERHRGYAVQWFALCGAVLLTWLTLMLRAPGPRRTA